nr:TonB-dependent receptor [Pedobacter sp. ASV19]
MKKCLTLFFLFLFFSGYTQTIQDSTKRLKEVIIRPYFSPQPLLRATGSIAVLDSTILNRQQGTSLVSSMNTIPGIRMEERSPGSYRLSIRGSLLRSPFGIRNIKIYLDDFPLTDAGGNTYLNALDVNAIGQIQVLKGPQSSLYGANSGGVVLISPAELTGGKTALDFKLQGGSFGLFQENLGFGKNLGKYQFNLVQAYQHGDGYRDHSAMDRKYLQLSQKLDYSAVASAKALFFYSDLHYDTPGGLTEAQNDQNPQQSRPAAGAVKSAADQQAGIYSKTLYGGLSNNWQISKGFKHVASLFSSYTDFKNPFITNYEHRKEFTLGLRTYVQYERKLKDLNWKFDLGLESMETSTDYHNSDNNFGTPGKLQAADRLKAISNVAFLHMDFNFLNKWLLELSGSANFYKYHYRSSFPLEISQKTNQFNTQFMPRAALSYLFDQHLSLRSSISKGYSPPTLAEVRSSNNSINVDLQPEYGWNYESGFRYEGWNKRFFADVTGFFYNLRNAIVKRLNNNDTEYFINAGGTRQWGLETSMSCWIISPGSDGWVKGLQLKTAYTLSRFKFKDYLDKTTSYSGNDLTGVPQNILVSSADLQLPKDIYVFIEHNYTSKIPLNDANTIYAKSYHLLQAKIGYKNIRVSGVPVEIFLGADNILNQRYSLGNDLNAANGRYFNTAATRNFYGGLALKLNTIH